MYLASRWISQVTRLRLTHDVHFSMFCAVNFLLNSLPKSFLRMWSYWAIPSIFPLFSAKLKECPALHSGLVLQVPLPAFHPFLILRTMASNKTAGHSLIKDTHWSPKPKDLRMWTDWGLGCHKVKRGLLGRRGCNVAGLGLWKTPAWRLWARENFPRAAVACLSLTRGGSQRNKW